MKRKDLTRVIIYVIILAVFNLIYFLLGGILRPITSWISFAFCWISIIVPCVAPLFCLNYKRIPENLATIYVPAWIYMILGVGLNSFFAFSRFEMIKLCIIINAVLLAAYLIQLIINLNVNYNVEKNLESLDAEREYVKATSDKLKHCMNIAKDDTARRAIEKAYDVVRTSPVHSGAGAMNYEVEVIRLTDALESSVFYGKTEEMNQILNSIIVTAKKRNSVL